jgi:hypothetical protein
MTATAPAAPALSYYPTPADIADDLVVPLLQPWHALGDGVRVLEPSAGEGHLVRAIREHLPEAHLAAVEPALDRAAVLRRLGETQPPAVPSYLRRYSPHYWPKPHQLVDEVIEGTLEAYLADVAVQAFAGQWEPFHLVVMNPPFTLDGRPEVWAEHVLAIYNDPYLLAPGGVIGAVVPHVVKTGKSKKVRAVRELLNPHYGVQVCERGAFASVGAKVSTALIWAEKP